MLNKKKTYLKSIKVSGVQCGLVLTKLFKVLQNIFFFCFTESHGTTWVSK